MINNLVLLLNYEIKITNYQCDITNYVPNKFDNMRQIDNINNLNVTNRIINNIILVTLLLYKMQQLLIVK